MERPPVFSLEVLADRALVKDIVKGVLSTIFFHRFFPTIRPKTRDLLELTLPAVDDPELEGLIDERTTLLIKAIEASTSSGSKSHRGQMAVEFYERRPKKAWFSKAEEKVCWEQWVLNITLVTIKTESDRARARASLEQQLQKTILEVITTANLRKEHIPPITTNDSNPFPYQIIISPKGETWGARMGIF